MTDTRRRREARWRDAAARVRLEQAETRVGLGLLAGGASTLWDAEHDFPRLEREIAATRRMVEKVGDTVAELRRHGELTERAKRHGAS